MSWLSPTPFNQAEVESHDELQGEYGEKFWHVPTFAKPNYTPQPDPRKPRYELPAFFSWEGKFVRFGQEDSGLASRDPKLTIQVCHLRWPVNRGDQFVRDKTGDIFEVTSAYPDGMSGVDVDLVQLGRPE